MEAAPLPLFPKGPAPARRAIPGFSRGDRVAWDVHGDEVAGAVLVTFPHFNEVVVKRDNGFIVTLPPSKLRRI